MTTLSYKTAKKRGGWLNKEIKISQKRININKNTSVCLYFGLILLAYAIGACARRMLSVQQIRDHSSTDTT
jgi:hypothetical protein